MQRLKIVSPGSVNRLILGILGAAFVLRATSSATSTSSASPSSADTVAFSNCTSEPRYIGDGRCDHANNNVVCCCCEDHSIVLN